MSARLATDAFGRLIGGGEPVTISSGPSLDTTSLVKKAGDTMTGNLDMGSNKITTSSLPTSDNDVVTKKHTENASNLKTGSILANLIPQTLNSFALNGNSIFFKNINSGKHFISEKVIDSKPNVQLDGDEGIILSVGNTHYMSLKSNLVTLLKELKIGPVILSGEGINLASKNIINLKELKTDNVAEPIILNDSGLTLDDHTLRFRGPTDNNNSIRWFNGSLTTGQPRLEISSINRVRLSTYQNRDGNYENPRTFLNTQNQYVELRNDRFDMNKNRIVNVVDPVDPQDAVTKSYLETQITGVAKYQRILTDYSPTFWISSKFPFGLKDDKTTIQDLTGNGLTISGTVGRDMQFGLTSRITSTASYTTKFTFFIKAKKTSTRPGRIFTSSTGNIFLGWWDVYRRCAWMNENFFGVNNNRLSDDGTRHTYILTNDEDTKNFYSEKDSVVAASTLGDSSWNGNIVIGQPISPSTENSEYLVYEAIGFNKVLLETQIFDIYDTIFA